MPPSDQQSTLSAVRLLAVAVFAGLALIAGAVVYYTQETRDSDRYANAERIVSAALNTVGEKPESVRHLTGPFVVVKFEDGLCSLIDVSTQYSGGDSGNDFFWATYPGDTKSVDC